MQLYNLLISFNAFILLNKLIITQILPVTQPDQLCDLIISTEDKIILHNCLIGEEWKDISQERTDQNFFEIYEGVSNIRRSFTIEYKPNPSRTSPKTPIIISEVIVSNLQAKYMKPTLLSDAFPYILNEGDSLDILVEYNCVSHWDDINVQLSIRGYSFPINFYYRKICSMNYLKTLNSSYLITMALFLICLYGFKNSFLINKDHFVQINIESILQTKNVEKILLITLIIIIVILFFIIIGYIYVISFIASTIISIISITSLVRFVLTLFFPKFIDMIETKTFLIYNIMMNYGKLLFYMISTCLFIVWFIVKSIPEMILNNLIVFIISYFAIHKLNWKKFYMVFGFYLITLIYQITILTLAEVPTTFVSQIYSLTTRLVINAPIRFVIPDIVNSPYDIIYFFTIVDLVLVGFVLKYLERSSKFNAKFAFIGQYGTYLGMLLNLITFYFFKFAPPVYVIPCTVIIMWAIVYSFWIGEAMAFFDIDAQKRRLKEMAEAPLGIIGADHSEDFANVEREYMPPTVFKIKDGSGSFVEEEKYEMKEIKDVDYINIHNETKEEYYLDVDKLNLQSKNNDNKLSK